jgi:nitroreductase
MNYGPTSSGTTSGQAVAALSVQATALGLSVHQMAGFDAAAARDVLGVPEDHAPLTAIAIGYRDDPSALPDDLRERELTPRVRRTQDEFVFHGRFGSA